jgi:hypothetical protein
MGRCFSILLGAWVAAACQPNTTRPSFLPLPDAAGTEVRLSAREATRHLAEALRARSIPVKTVRLRDGYLETDWFDSKSGRPTRRRPIGPDVVRVRGWAEPARPGSSQVVVETAYRPLVDPSLPARELERQVAQDHPVAVKVEEALRQLLERYGGPPAAQPAPAAPTADSARYR